MLDANLIKFVEPIGPGQIVDRESLVALPAGQIQMTIETDQNEVTVHVLEMRNADLSLTDDNPASSWNVSAYIWQNGQVIVAEKLAERPPLSRSKTLSRLGTIGKRRANLAARKFRFAREQATENIENSVVDAILQICVYKSLGNAMHKKAFLGTVHIALNYLTSSEQDGVEDAAVCTEEWFKIFPKSTFLPGCPSSIAKTNCAISGEQKQPGRSLDASPVSKTPVRSPDAARSHLTVSFSQYRLDRSQSSSSTSISIVSEPKEPLPRTCTDPNPKKTQLIASWVKRKILRQASVPLATRQRTPDSAKCSQAPDLAPVIVGPRRRLRTSASAPSGCGGAAASSASLTTDEKTDRLPVPELCRSAKGSVRKSGFRVSRSNNSSFDVGYESGRSRYLSSSDEESAHSNAEPKSDALCMKNIAVAMVHRTADDPGQSLVGSTGNQGAVSRPSSCGATGQKQRPAMLRRSKRITEDGGFTSLKEIRRLDSICSQDSAISSNS